MERTPPARNTGSIGLALFRQLMGKGTLAQFLRNASIVLLVGIVGKLISFPVNIVLARVLGTEEFGVYTVVTNWLGLLILVQNLGLSESLVRFIPSYRATEEWSLLRGLLQRAFQLVVLASATAAGLVGAVALGFSDAMSGNVTRTLLAACLVLPIVGLNQLRGASLRALRRVGWSESLPTILSPALLAAGVLALSVVGDREITSALAMLVSGVSGAVVLFVGGFVLARALPREIRGRTPAYRTFEWVRVSLPLLFHSLMLAVLARTDILMVGVLLGPAEAGVYAVATTVAQFTMFGLTASNASAQPMISELYTRRDFDQLRRLVAVLVWVSAVTSFGSGVLLLLLRGFFLGLFGPDFAQGAIAMTILVVGRILASTTGPSGALLAMTSYQDRGAAILGVTTVLNVGFVYAGIRLGGIEGAAAGSTVSLLLMTAWVWLEVRARLGLNASVFGPLPVRLQDLRR